MTYPKSPRNVNWTALAEGKTRIRVICPECSKGGSHCIESYKPRCDVCHYRGKDVLMEPASNDRIECTWEEFHAYFEENKHLFILRKPR